MGGRWDATSVADAQVAVVAPISLDHTHLLGRTIAEIAGEKSGIIKPGSVAVLAGQTPEAAQVLMARCVEVGAPMVREGVDFGLLAKDGSATQVPVQVAPSGEPGRIEILSGVSAGDTLIGAAPR